MKLTKIDVENFKSFSNETIPLANLNIILGPNASGKSNLTSVFQFLHDAVSVGLEDAVSMQGGINYLKNMNLKSDIIRLKIEGVSNHRYQPLNQPKWTHKKTHLYIIGIKAFSYKFALKIVGNSFSKHEEEFRTTFTLVKLPRGKKNENGGDSTEKNLVGSGTIVVNSSENNPQPKISFDWDMQPEDDVKKWFSDDITENKFSVDEEEIKGEEIKEGSFKELSKDLFIKNIFSIGLHPMIFLPFTFCLQGLTVYNFDPFLAKRAIPISGRIALEPDGSNIAIVLRRIFQDETTKRKFLMHLKDFLPFIEDVDTTEFLGKSVLLKFKEQYAHTDLPAYLISEGTLNICLLILLLYFQSGEMIIIEEPERNIHPHLILNIVSALKKRSEKVQIVVTTHNPFFVKGVKLENILRISRNAEGHSEVRRISELEEIKKFLDQDLGVEDLFVQNLL